MQGQIIMSIPRGKSGNNKTLRAAIFDYDEFINDTIPNDMSTVIVLTAQQLANKGITNPNEQIVSVGIAGSASGTFISEHTYHDDPDTQGFTALVKPSVAYSWKGEYFTGWNDSDQEEYVTRLLFTYWA